MGGLATAIVAALVAILGVLVVRALFDVPLLAPTSAGSLGDASTWGFAALAALAALLATALMHVLLLSTPRPLQFFSWITVLITLIAAVLPFLTAAPLDEKIATAVITLIIGTVIGMSIRGVARSAVSSQRARRPMAGY